MTNNRDTLDRPRRISPFLSAEIDRINQQRFSGRLPFARASEVLLEDKRKLEEEIEKLRKQNDSRGSRRLV